MLNPTASGGITAKTGFICQFFLDFELIRLESQSESPLQCPGSGNWACKKSKSRMNDSTNTVWMSGF